MKKNKKFFKKVLTNIILSDIIISEGNKNPKKAQNGQTVREESKIIMLDKEYLKSIVKSEMDRYAVAVEKLNESTVRESETLQRYYERRERFLKGRVQGMEDMIYDLGYLVLHSPNGDIDIIEIFD